MYTVFGGEGCTYCKQAINLLQLKEEPFEYLDIYLDICKVSKDGEFATNRDLLFQMMEERGLPLPRSIPQIFRTSPAGVTEYVGGFDDLRAQLT